MFCDACFAENRNISRLKWVIKNREKSIEIRKAFSKLYREKNYNSILKNNRLYKEKNPEWAKKQREKANASRRGQFRVDVRIRKKRFKIATPIWLNKVQKKHIKGYYKTANELSKSDTVFHVDHIYPLTLKNENGDHIGCGLHVPWNLQILSSKDNLSKGSKI
jgi:hypothetical protein